MISLFSECRLLSWQGTQCHAFNRGLLCCLPVILSSFWSKWKKSEICIVSKTYFSNTFKSLYLVISCLLHHQSSLNFPTFIMINSVFYGAVHSLPSINHPDLPDNLLQWHCMVPKASERLFLLFLLCPVLSHELLKTCSMTLDNLLIHRNKSDVAGQKKVQLWYTLHNYEFSALNL